VLVVLSLAVDAQIIKNEYVNPQHILKLRVESVMIHLPDDGWLYSHHPFITVFKNRLIALWSNGISYEDKPGQRILIATSDDFFNWTSPTVVANPSLYNKDSLNILTAGGFYQFGDFLVLYYGEYSPFYQNTKLWARVSTDGRKWSNPIDLKVPVIPNHGLQKLLSGRLVLSGNFCFPYTDDYRGLTGWALSSFFPKNSYSQDNSALFSGLASKFNIAPVCEGSFFQTPDGIIHMMLRAAGSGWKGKLWMTQSRDNGTTWKMPTETLFTDNDSKIHFGTLPGTGYYYIGNPDTSQPYSRISLILSISKDGILFTKNYIVANEPYNLKQKGAWKGNEYGYPHSVINKGYMYIIVSKKKESIEVLRFKMDNLFN
jgi:hypothetical protein